MSEGIEICVSRGLRVQRGKGRVGKGVTGKRSPSPTSQAKVLFRYLSTFGRPIIERPL